MKSKRQFLSSLDALESAVSDPVVVRTELLSMYPAQLLRTGLAVIGFAMLEEFIRSRTAELTNSIDSQNIHFYTLPEKLKRAATKNALEGIRFRSKFQIGSPDDKHRYYIESLSKISSLGRVNYAISEMAFCSSDSNISSESFQDILRCFGFDKVWDQLDQIAYLTGFPSGVLQSEFENAISRRHNAAHVAGFGVSASDIVNYSRAARACASSFDILLSYGIHTLNHELISSPNGVFKCDSSSITLRCLTPTTSGTYTITNPRTNKRIRTGLTRTAALRYLINHRAKAPVYVIDQDVNGLMRNWQILQPK